MDKRLLRYAGGGGAISLLACGLLCMALGALAGGEHIRGRAETWPGWWPAA